MQLRIYLDMVAFTWNDDARAILAYVACSERNRAQDRTLPIFIGPDHGARGTVPDMPPGAFIWPVGAPMAYTSPWGEHGGCFYCNSGRWVLILAMF